MPIRSRTKNSGNANVGVNSGNSVDLSCITPPTSNVSHPSSRNEAKSRSGKQPDHNAATASHSNKNNNNSVQQHADLHGHKQRQRQSKKKRKKSDRNKKSGRLLTCCMVLVLCLLIGIWIVLTVFLMRTTKSKHVDTNDMIANVQQVMQKGDMHKVPQIAQTTHTSPIHATPKVTPNAKEMIDMRQMARTLPFDNPDGGVWKQGWDVQPVDDSRPLQIFVVPHSHCDPGWIKTFDQYFQSQTKTILSSVVESLAKDARRKFIWAEISYFEWWWKEQSADVQQLTKQLLANGQLEFVTGGWVQPDEANTQLYAMEIQLQEGHDFITSAFGGKEYLPKYGWSIDPFGYSPTMAYLLQKYGFHGMLIQRVHYAVKKELAKHKQLEFMWRQTWDNDGQHDIFTHTMPFFSYDVPHTCGPDPSVCCQFDFARVQGFHNGGSKNKGGFANYGKCPWKKNVKPIDDSNVEERSLLLLDQYRKKANLYRSNVVLAPLGDDFRYQSVREADYQFENYQRIFDYINDNVDNVSIQFGTLSQYFEAVMGKFEPPILKGSFFTYADREQDYWSGYFTSRIFDKALDRKLERLLFAASKLGYSRTDLQDERRALSLFQHHDGVTGTAKTHVVLDYAKRIHAAIGSLQSKIAPQLLGDVDGHGFDLHTLKACWQSDAPRGLSQNLCAPDAKILVYNPVEFDQVCGDVVVPPRKTKLAQLPCEVPGGGEGTVQFDENGLMTHPIREEWMVWKVSKGGAYLFFPGKLQHHDVQESTISEDGYVLETEFWKRTVVVKKPPNGESATVIDFIYETDLQTANEEWFVRFSGDIANAGVFHTDLNGYNFDTHYFRDDMPIQSQVFPMPTHASIEDSNQRLTVLSEHAQGAASLQEGSIDIWLDRRLKQDDARGLAQGVTDNVPTRTRLRVVVEDGKSYDTEAPEFIITPLAKRMWKELNHPLEMFGKVTQQPKSTGGLRGIASFEDLKIDASNLGQITPVNMPAKKEKTVEKSSGPDPINFATETFPFVYMVYQRVDYLKEAIASLRQSDFPRDRVPVIISHDGRVAEVVEFVEELKREDEFDIIQVFHPFSCLEHPDTFPGDDPKLNIDYAGDTYLHKREAKITCCKHHFTWLLNQVFGSVKLGNARAFLFLEEDYVIAPMIYRTLVEAYRAIDRGGYRERYFGVTLDPTEGFMQSTLKGKRFEVNKFIHKVFVTGPMAIDRAIYAKIRSGAKEYCTFDDYNWDWSMVHLMAKGILPEYVVSPSKPQAIHIGLEGGMHEKNMHAMMKRLQANIVKGKQLMMSFEVPTNANLSTPPVKKTRKARKGYGGWGHPADHQHCLELFGITDDESKASIQNE